MSSKDNLPEILQFLQKELLSQKARSLLSFTCKLFHLPELTQWLTHSTSILKSATAHIELTIGFHLKGRGSQGEIRFEGHPDDIKTVLPFVQSLQSQRRADLEIRAAFSFRFSSPLPLTQPDAFLALMRPFEKFTTNKCDLSLLASLLSNEP